MIGTVFADNTKDPDSRSSIGFGFCIGTGLLGDVIAAIRRLEKTALKHGYYCEDGNDPEELKQARLAVYDALKRIEEAS